MIRSPPPSSVSEVTRINCELQQGKKETQTFFMKPSEGVKCILTVLNKKLLGYEKVFILFEV